MTDFDELLKFAHRLADLSGAAILPHFRNLKAIEDKSGGERFDPVTVADRSAEEVIRSEIAAHWPDHGVVGEEFGDTNPDAEFCWIVDPIDGTRSFMMGMPLWGTLIGLLQNQATVLGVMNQPFTGERFWAGPKGAYHRGPQGEHKISSRPCPRLEDAVLTTTNPDMLAGEGELERFEALAERVRLRWYGGDCYGYCLLATGHIDIIVESGLSAYDIAPLVPIVEEAGGCITNWSGRPVTRGGDVVACGDPTLHEQALKVLSG